MLRAVDHLELISRDLQASIAFYEVLGFELIRETEHHGRSVEMKLPGPGQFVLEMHEPWLEEIIGVNHVAYRVDDVAAAIEGLEKAGARLEKGPVFFEATGRTLANLRDPDGWRLQIVANAPIADDREPAGMVERLDHLDYYTSDLVRFAAFCRDIGLEQTREMEHFGLASLEFHFTGDPPSSIDVHQVGKNHVVGLNHIGLLTADIHAAVDELRGRGYRLDVYPPIFVESTERTVCTVRDPSGWRVQLTQKGR